jgi:hypothetical protein
MAEITRKRVGELQRGVFKILLSYADGLPANEVLEKLESVVPPTDFEKSDYPNRPGVRRFEKIVRFATIAPVKAGWLVKSKGRWEAVAAFREALKEYTRELMTQNNLGVALQSLGERESGTARLEEALAAIEAAFESGMLQDKNHLKQGCASFGRLSLKIFACAWFGWRGLRLSLELWCANAFPGSPKCNFFVKTDAATGLLGEWFPSNSER